MKAKSHITYNVHAQAVTNTERLKKHLQNINPVAVLVMDGQGLANEIKALLPDCMVIQRFFMDADEGGDDNIHTRISPEEWLKRIHAIDKGERKTWYYVPNEPGFNEQTLGWLVRLIELNALDPHPLSLVVGNFAVGIPPGNDPVGAWALARRLLELLDKYRAWCILGLHEYGCGVMTSGLVGGSPDDPAHPNYIIPENWPPSIYTPPLTTFHCGRFNFLVQYCKNIGLKPPRVILTEHGMDDLSDIKFWSSKLRVSGSYLNIRGWKTLKDQWIEWYRFTKGWQPEQAYFEQVKWADQAIYQGSIVEAQCMFSWGYTSKNWEQFDLAYAHDFQAQLEEYVRAMGEIPEPPPPVVEPPPVEPPPAPEPEPTTQVFKIVIEGAAADKEYLEWVAQLAAAVARHRWAEETIIQQSPGGQNSLAPIDVQILYPV